MTWINSKEVAELLCITLQAVNKSVLAGKYGDKIRYIKGRGRSGRILQVALEVLPEEIQRKWQNKENTNMQQNFPVDNYSIKKRTASDNKLMIIDEYRNFIVKNANTNNQGVNLIESFASAWNVKHPEQRFSERSLYRWIAKLEKAGMEALVDKRGGWNKGESSISDEIWRLFKYYYLDENKPSLKICYDRVRAIAKGKGISLPSINSFEKMVKNIPKPVLVRWREGMKAFDDQCMPYITRDYTSYYSNQIWVTDHHIFDQLVIGPGNKLIRPWGTYFEDMRSRFIVARYVRCKEPNADVVLACFASGVNNFSIPSEIILDNGRDYKTPDIFNTEEKNRTNSLARQLDIITHYSIPYNAKAKPIERFFRTFEEQFGKLWKTYCGNHPKNRPQRLKNLKIDQYPTLEEWKALHDLYIDQYYNMAPHSGNGMDGKSPYAVYHENLIEKRVAPKEILRLFMMRTTRELKVQRNGVRLFDKHFWSPELVEHQGKLVYARYNPDAIDMVYIYNASDDIFICEAYNRELKGSSSDDYRELNSRKKAIRKFVKEYKGDVTDVVENPDDIEWYLCNKGRQLEEEISTTDFITPVLKPVINEFVKKASRVAVKINKKANIIQVKEEKENQAGRDTLEAALKLMVVK